MPGGEATAAHIRGFEQDLVNRHQYVSARCMGGRSYDELSWTTKPKVAEIRIGGIPKSTADHFMVIGDAAAHTDPLTGEGIHTAMLAGKIAATVIAEMFSAGDFSNKSCAVYHERVSEAFVSDFKYSTLMAHILVRFPIFLDALAAVGVRKGQWFLDEYGLIMTGVKGKHHLLQPGLLLPLAAELINQIVQQYIFKVAPAVTDIPLPKKTKVGLE